ncbi:DUF5131 family protein [Zavarzinella formosa]|uniref:DUF5131 family protein n=1 Tax=Zavarzinella formosa TaxID=360055 RepID=UPI000305D737|nr:phage Gp37/Gp68 family protein [Zavarzinella formosa]
MSVTGIEWTDRTWNPVVGCQKVSPGCKNCYAKTLHDLRHKAFHKGKRMPLQYAKPFEEVQLIPDRLMDPLSWRKPQRVFVNSVSDLFHESVPDEFIDRVFGVMAMAKQHTFQVLTKRPERMLKYFHGEGHFHEGGSDALHQRIGAAAGTFLDGDWIWNEGKKFRPLIERFISVTLGYAGEEADDALAKDELDFPSKPLPNVWLGVSVEDQQRASERIPSLLQTPAAVRFLSCEPLLGPLNLSKWLACPECNGSGEVDEAHDFCTEKVGCRCMGEKPLNWAIIGGESGDDARQFQTGWGTDIIMQCKSAGVAVFMKQLGGSASTRLPSGERWPNGDGPLSPVQFSGDGFGNYTVLGLKDKKGGDIDEWPEDLRVREFPKVGAT